MMSNLCRWGEIQYSYVTCADEGWNTIQLCNLYKWGWNTVQCSYVMQLVQLRLNLCRWGVEHDTIVICYASCANEVELAQNEGRVEHSTVMHLVQMRSNLYKWGVEHSTVFICYAACVDEVELVYIYIYGNLVSHAEECNYCLRLTHVQWYVQPFSHSVLKGNIWNEIETTGV